MKKIRTRKGQGVRKKRYKKIDLKSINWDDKVRVTKKRVISFSIKSRIRNPNTRNLKVVQNIDILNGFVTEIPKEALGNINDFELWIEDISKEFSDGVYYIHGRSIGNGRVDNLFQVPIAKFRIVNGIVKINIKDKYTKAKKYPLKYGIRNYRTARKYMIFRKFDEDLF